MSAGNKHAHT